VRYPVGHKERTRRRIVAAAARRFRQRGYHAVGVDEVMKACGLTPGGFYAHFASKRALLTEALEASGEEQQQMLFGGLEDLGGPALLRAVVGRYLSRTHRDAAADGCPLPALAAEAARAGAAPRRSLQRYLRTIVAATAHRVPPAPGLSPEDRVLATAAVLAGGLLLARAVEDDELSERILRASRRLAVPELAEQAEREQAQRQSHEVDT
jgi:TetR/AcrR family transcriptional repressor of nem operon